MNFVLVVLSAPVMRGTEELRSLIEQFQKEHIQKVSSIYRQVSDDEHETLNSKMRVVMSLLTPLSLNELKTMLVEQTESHTGAEWSLLSFNQDVLLDPDMPIPHPDLHLDPLVLHCAAEIHGGFEHPVLGRSLQELVKSTQNSPQKKNFEFLSRGAALLMEGKELI